MQIERDITFRFMLIYGYNVSVIQNRCTGLLKTNNMGLSLIYSKNLSSTYFEWTNYTSSSYVIRRQIKDMQHMYLGRLASCWSLKPELNPSAQRCLMRFITGDFASWTVHFVNVCVKNQQMQRLFTQFINYVWYLLHVSELHCHLQGAFLVPSERCSIEDQSIEYCGWECCV
jgi:hypothetical protein